MKSRHFNCDSPSPRKKPTLRLERLEDRCVPSAAGLVELGAGLDGDLLLSDPLFATEQGHHNSKALQAAQGGPGSGQAGNATIPQTGSTLAGPAAPAPTKPAGFQNEMPTIILGPTATLTVNTLLDETNPDSTLSLREAIQVVNTGSTAGLSAGELAQISGTPGAGSLIQFASGLSGTISLYSALALNQNMTIAGNGGIAISGGGTTRIFTEAAGTTVTLQGLTLQDGRTAGGASLGGGAILNNGALTVSYCTFSNNNCEIGGGAGGGAILSTGAGATLTVTGSTFTGNLSDGFGAAIYAATSSASVSISNSTFTGNGNYAQTAAAGAVEANTVTTSITNDTFSQNAASGNGGALRVGHAITATISNSTFSGNISGNGDGGAIRLYSDFAVTIKNCAITDNTAYDDGGGIFDLATVHLTMSQCTVTGNSATNDTTNSKGHGGGAYFYGGSAIVSNSTFSSNSSTYGGGVEWKANNLYKGSLSLTNVSVAGNTALAPANAGGLGGGVLIDGGSYLATLTGALISGNQSVQGGGLYTRSLTHIYDSLILNNSAISAGGGIGTGTASTVTIQTTTIANNTATGVSSPGLLAPLGNGGGINNQGAMTITASTISGNTASLGVFGRGGGIYNISASLLAIFNSTIADNIAQGAGGGFYDTGATAILVNDTIAFNQAGTAAGLGGGLATTFTNTDLINTIIAKNTVIGGTTASDISGTLSGVAKYDLIGTGGAGGLINGTNNNQVGVANPLLGNLASNGGLTQTVMLLPGSPAINTGSTASYGLTTDQRGLTRPVGQRDIGAVEVQPAGVATHFAIQEPAQVSTGVAFSIGVSVEDDFGTVVTGFTGTVTFTSSDFTAILPTPYTFTAADAGVHHFTITLNALGTQSITLTDAADSLAGLSLLKVVPASGAFFIDGNNQLWLYTNGKFTNTGGFAKTFSAGIDSEGNPECWFLDGNNQLWKYDNGAFTNTGAFALKIAAGEGFVAFTDGVNQIWTLTDGRGFKNTGGFASRFTAGFDSRGNNQIVFADGINQLWTYDATTGKFTNTGGFTKLFVAGQDAAGNNEIWFTDGNNQIWRLDQGQFTQTSGFALSITGSGGGQMYFSDGINQIWIQTDAGVFTNTGGFASHISGSPGSTALFFSDGINQLWQLFNGVFTNTGGFASNFSAF
jgi:hypothetical protein